MTPDHLLVRRSVAETVQWPALALDALGSSFALAATLHTLLEGGSSVLLPSKFIMNIKCLTPRLWLR